MYKSRKQSGEGSGTPLQYSCLENPVDGGAWQAAVHRVAKSWTGLSDFTFTFHFHTLEKEMATHSSVLAQKIPGTGEPGGLPYVGSQESDTTELTQQHQQEAVMIGMSSCLPNFPPPFLKEALWPPHPIFTFTVGGSFVCGKFLLIIIS